MSAEQFLMKHQQEIQPKKRKEFFQAVAKLITDVSNVRTQAITPPRTNSTEDVKALESSSQASSSSKTQGEADVSDNTNVQSSSAYESKQKKNDIRSLTPVIQIEELIAKAKEHIGDATIQTVHSPTKISQSRKKDSKAATAQKESSAAEDPQALEAPDVIKAIRLAEQEALRVKARDSSIALLQAQKPSLYAARTLLGDEAKTHLCAYINEDTLYVDDNTKQQNIDTKIGKLKVFLEKYNVENVISELFGTTSHTDSLSATQKQITDGFNAQELKNHYFDSNSNIAWKYNAQDLFTKCYKFCEYQMLFQEGTALTQQDLHKTVTQRAYNMLALFGEDGIEQTIANYEKFALLHSPAKTPLTQLLERKIPKYTEQADAINGSLSQGPLDLPSWREAFFDHGMEALKLFSDNGRFAENHIKRTQHKKNVPTTSEEIAGCKAASYANAEENHLLAQQYRKLDVPEAMFDAVVKFQKESEAIPSTRAPAAIIPSCNIPDISVKISDKLYMVKLQSNDPRALILGHLTNCCQSINGHSKQCVKDGVQLENNGFYVFVELERNSVASTTEDNISENLTKLLDDGNAKIVGQSYAWKSRKGNLVLDSLEILESHRKKLDIPGTLEKFGTKIITADRKSAEKVTNADSSTEKANIQGQVMPKILIEKISVGIGGGTGDALAAINVPIKSLLKDKQKILEGVMYYDGSTQYVMYMSPELRAQKTCELGKIPEAALTAILNSDKEKYEALTSLAALGAYASGKVQVSDLSDKPAEQIKILTSGIAVSAYTTGAVNVGDLKNSTTDTIKKDILKICAHKICKEDQDKLSYIDNLDADVIDALLLSSAIASYKRGKVKISDLQECNVSKIKILTSFDKERLYGYTTVSDVKNWDIEKIRVLGDHAAYALYTNPPDPSYYKFSDLKDYNIEKIKALSTPGVTNLLQNGVQSTYFTSDPTNTGDDILKMALRVQAVRRCGEGQNITDTSYIANLPHEVLETLLSTSAVDGYQRKLFQPSKLKDYKDEILKILISDKSKNAIGFAGATIEALSVGSSQKEIKQNILKAWATNKCGETDVGYIDKLEESIIDSLSSEPFLKEYIAGKATVSDFKNLSLDKMNVLKNHYIQSVYSSPSCNMRDVIHGSIADIQRKILKAYVVDIMKDQDTSFIDKFSPSDLNIFYDVNSSDGFDSLKSAAARNCYRKGILPNELYEIYGDGPSKFELLTKNDCIQKMYDTKYTTIQELSEIYDNDPQKLISLLENPHGREILNEGYSTIKELADIYDSTRPETMEALSNVKAMYKTPDPFSTVKELSDIYKEDPKKFQEVTRYIVHAMYQNRYATVKELSNIYKEDPEKFKVVTNHNSRTMYQNSYATVKELSDIYKEDPKKFQVVTNYNSKTMYQNSYATVKELSDLYQEDPKKLEALMSYGVIEVYKNRGATIKELAEIYQDADIFKILTIYPATEMYKNSYATAKELSEIYKKDPQIFEILTNSHTLQMYKKANIQSPGDIIKFAKKHPKKELLFLISKLHDTEDKVQDLEAFAIQHNIIKEPVKEETIVRAIKIGQDLGGIIVHENGKPTPPPTALDIADQLSGHVVATASSSTSRPSSPHLTQQRGISD